MSQSAKQAKVETQNKEEKRSHPKSVTRLKKEGKRQVKYIVSKSTV